MRQNAIAAALSRDRTRLPHQLTRMEKRAYVARSKVENEVEVSLRPEGRSTIDASTPNLADSTRRHLLDRLGPDDVKALKDIAERLLTRDDGR
ncbi:DNA-binding MarR family transcriptional regulator [Saccharothrix coeruleofusca]|uniref:hypothetical protein n=1 Tax=Saccharothrix coeruleofusca TaxID=33919 RepID=UPI001FD39046|nr:hypothetical protein [Saccharothrix coeruleofusca]MBP2337404.1 DNA-binding MarR family transcriptional regulator [Saccharothrix coeruleofusca]